MKTIYVLQNGKKLDQRKFIDYFEKKVLYTIRKYKLLDGIKNNYNSNARDVKVQDFFVLKKIDNVFISQESVDEIAIQVLKTFMKKGDIKRNLNKLGPAVIINNQKIIRPFYLMKKEEMKIYACIKKIKLDIKNKKENPATRKIEMWLSDLEKKHLEIKNAVVNSLLKIEKL